MSRCKYVIDFNTVQIESSPDGTTAQWLGITAIVLQYQLSQQ